MRALGASCWHRLTLTGAACVLLAGASAGPAIDPASAPSPAADGAARVIATYRDRIPQLMAEQGIPGLAVALVDRDEVLWTEGFGHLDDAGSPQVTVDTMFSVQSTSKNFTAVAVMQAAGAGLLDLDEPITTYLPNFTVHSAFEGHPERKITLRMLLSHTAGFTNEAPIGNDYERDPGTFESTSAASPTPGFAFRSAVARPTRTSGSTWPAPSLLGSAGPRSRPSCATRFSRRWGCRGARLTVTRSGLRPIGSIGHTYPTPDRRLSSR